MIIRLEITYGGYLNISKGYWRPHVYIFIIIINKIIINRIFKRHRTDQYLITLFFRIIVEEETDV